MSRPVGRAVGQGHGPGLDAVAILEAVEPAPGDRVDAVVGAGHGPEDRPGRVRVAAEVDDLGDGFLEAVGRQQEVEAGRDAGRREAHGRPLADRLGAVPIGLVDQGRQGAVARQVEDRLGVGDGPGEAAGVFVELDDDVGVVGRDAGPRP